MDEELLKKKWVNHKHSAKDRGLKPLTLDEYRQKLIDAGIQPHMVGQRRESYHLSRKTDRGDYTVESCRFLLHLENTAEKVANGGAARAGEKIRGRTKHTHAYLAIMAEKKRTHTNANFPHLAESHKRTGEKLRGRSKENYAGLASTSRKLEKYYSFISPSGERVSGINMEDFAKSLGLQGAGFSRIKHGLRKQYRGWLKDPEWQI